MRGLVALLAWLLAVAVLPGHARAQIDQRAMIGSLELDAASRSKTFTFPDTIDRSIAVRVFARAGSVVITRIVVAYGNGQTHYEQREIRLDRGEFTRDINRTPDGRLPTSLTIDYRIAGGGEPVTVEIWSVLAPVAPGVAKSLGDRPAAGGKPYEEVLIQFATNRRQETCPPRRAGDCEKKGNPIVPFSGEIDTDLKWGEAVISVPRAREKGSIPRPVKDFYVFQWEYRAENPAIDFTVVRSELVSADAFTASMERIAGVAKDFAGHAFVFVHGYNVTFDDALFRAAQLAHDVGFDGPVATFSWPSRGATLDYKHDLESARASKEALQQVLERVAAVKGITRVNLVAHSMGNDPVLELLAGHRDLVAAGGQVKPLKLNEIVLAAPDVSRAFFLQRARDLLRIATGVTLYAASNDLALAASKRISRGVVRAGDVPQPEGPVVLGGVDTIDITNAGTSSFALNHSLFGDREPLIDDLRELLANKRAPRSDKFEPVTNGASKYWRYK